MIWRVFVGTLRQVRLADWIVLVGLVAMAVESVYSALVALAAFWIGVRAGVETLYVRKENDG